MYTRACQPRYGYRDSRLRLEIPSILRFEFLSRFLVIVVTTVGSASVLALPDPQSPNSTAQLGRARLSDLASVLSLPRNLIDKKLGKPEKVGKQEGEIFDYQSGVRTVSLNVCHYYLLSEGKKVDVRVTYDGQSIFDIEVWKLYLIGDWRKALKDVGLPSETTKFVNSFELRPIPKLPSMFQATWGSELNKVDVGRTCHLTFSTQKLTPSK